MQPKIEINLLSSIKTPELTTGMLLGLLAAYKDPRKKIHSFVKSGVLLPVKQGVYVVSKELNLRSYSLEILANLIYGPSYISLESALSFYGFIPERVTTTTSTCIGKSKRFSTAVGDFEYHHLKDSTYCAGVQLKEIFKNTYSHFASAEKAILDFIYIRERKGEFKNSKEYFHYLVESYRLDVHAVKRETSNRKITQLTTLYACERVNWFAYELRKRA
jgi:hypothetical protein